MTPTSAAVDISDLSVYYGRVRALDHVNLRLDPGRVCALIGVNGSGKSTLFKAVLDLVPRRGGRVQILGLSSGRARRAGIVAYVPQSEEIDTTFPVSVGDVVMSGRQGRMNFLRCPSAADRLAVEGALEAVGLSDLRGRQIGELSGGQRKRAFLARAIAQEARVLLLDEPFAGVDRASEEMLVDLVRDLATEGATLLVSTHDLQGVGALADEAALLSAGRLLAHDVPEVVCTPTSLAQVFGIGAEQGGADRKDRH